MKTYKDIISIDYFKRDPEKIDKMDSYHFDIDEKNINMIKNDTEVNKCQKKDVQKEILNAKKDTEHFTGTTCVLAINYGSRDEIVRGIKKLVENNVKTEDITEKLISDSLDIKDLPDVDLMIRTGGEERLSNFLLWQCAYAEFLFTDTLWPDYTENEFIEDIIKFQKRNRRFGAVPDQK